MVREKDEILEQRIMSAFPARFGKCGYDGTHIPDK